MESFPEESYRDLSVDTVSGNLTQDTSRSDLINSKFFDCLPIPQQIFDSTGRCLSSNQMFLKWFGRDFHLRDNPIVHHFGLLPEIEKYIQRFFESSGLHFSNLSFNAEDLFPLTCLEGIVSIEISYFPIVQNGKLLSIGATYKDVTKELRLSEELKEITFLFEKAEEIGRLGSWNSHLADDGNLVWSKNTYKVFGCNEDEFLGTVQSFFDKVHPEDREKVKQAAQQAMKTGEAYCVDHRVVCSDNSIRWVHERGKLIPGEGSRPTRFIGVCQDITERVETQEHLKVITERAKVLFESHLIGIFVTSSDGLITEANAEFLRMTGYSREDLQAQRLSWRNMTPDEYKSGDVAYGEIFNKTGRCPAFEKEFIKKDQTRFPILIGAAQCVLTDKPNDVIAFALDLTQVKALQKKLDRMKKLDGLGRLAGGVAHDFNNILGVITLHLEQLLKTETVAETQKKLLSIQECSERARRLIQQLLAFSRNQVGGAKSLCVGDVVSNMKEMLERLMTEDIKIEIQIEDRDYRVKADLAQIEQVIMNLATNARDAMPVGGTISISTEVETIDKKGELALNPGSYVVLRVADTGSGMEANVASHIFEPFYTTKEFGTGLGLASIYGIVQQTRGHIEMSTRLNRGTCFSIYLPVLSGDVPEKRSAPTLDASVSNATILVVEDQAELNLLISNILRDQGCEVISASSGREALQSAMKPNLKLDLIITDVIMPEMSGPALTNALIGNVPVIYISGYPQNELTKYGIRFQEEYFLSKPFTSRELLQKVSACLKQSDL